MSTSRTLLVAAVAALAVMLIGGAGPAAAQSSATPLTQSIAMTGQAKNGKKFTGTYTIKRFTRSGSTQYAVGTLKGRLKGRRVKRDNVRIPVALSRAAQASQIPPTPNACGILEAGAAADRPQPARTARAHEPHRSAGRGRPGRRRAARQPAVRHSPGSSTRRPPRRRRRRSSRRS